MADDNNKSFKVTPMKDGKAVGESRTIQAYDRADAFNKARAAITNPDQYELNIEEITDNAAA